MKTINVKTKLIPDIFIHNNTISKITKIDPKFIVKEFDIILHDDLRVNKVILKNGNHPHCNPRTKEYCIPEKLIGKKFNKLIYSFLISSFSIIDAGNCYEIPWGSINYEWGHYGF